MTYVPNCSVSSLRDPLLAVDVAGFSSSLRGPPLAVDVVGFWSPLHGSPLAVDVVGFASSLLGPCSRFTGLDWKKQY